MSINDDIRELNWLERAARQAAHDVHPGCLAKWGEPKPGDWRQHSRDCDRTTDIIIRHMRAALALQREKTE